MAQMHASRTLPAVLSMGRAIYRRAFPVSNPGQSPASPLAAANVGRGVADHRGMVPAAVEAAGGFEIGQQQGFGLEPTTAGLTADIGPALPLSLRHLITNNVKVKPERMLQDLAWDPLLQALGALDEGHAADVEREVERLNRMHRLGMKIDPKTAVEIFNRFASWTQLVDLGNLLKHCPRAPKDVCGGQIDLYTSDIDLLERMRGAVEACLKRGDFEQAQKLADCAIQKSGRLSALLDTLRKRLMRADEASQIRLRERLTTAGGLVVVALGASYMGYSLKLPGLPAELLTLTADAAMAGSVVCLLDTTVSWLNTPDFQKHLDRVQRIEFQRGVTRNQIDNLVCEAMIEAAARPLSPLPGAHAVDDTPEQTCVESV
mmetsp:Transcript_8681/g.22457  ORF Transcript_8681/g.22457 Transcript_8681/m.22457 type:complete len:375 (+) Transcript_8681:78-1202(+)